MKKFAFLIFLSLPNISLASTCSAIFADALQSNSTGDTITFVCNSKLINNPDTVLQTGTVSGPGGACATKSCSPTVNCTASGTPAGQLNPGPFQFENSATNVTVAASTTATIGTGGNTDTDRNNVTLNAGTVGTPTTLNFSDHSGVGTNVYRMNTLTINANTVINFQPGDYWINTLTMAGTAATLNRKFNVVGSTGTVRLFINNAPNIAREISWNTASAAANPAKQLFVYSYGNFTLNQTTSRIIGLVYAVGAVALTAGGNASGDVQGAVAGTNININGSTTVQYDGTAVNALDFGGLCPPAGTVDRLLLEGPASGILCVPNNVRVTAKIGNATATTYTKSITLDTLTGVGTWSLVTGAGTFVSGGATGQATYTYNVADLGTAVFQLNYASGGGGATTIQARETFNSLIQGTLPMTFRATSFLLTAAAVPPTTPFNATQIAGNSPSFTMRITSYGGGGCAVNTGYSGNHSIQFWSDYSDPTTGTVQVNINGTAIATTQAASVGQTVNFTSGTATLTVFYRDVGKIRINALDTGSTRQGSTDVFVVKPDHFTITGTGIPGTTSATGTVFKKAGQAFTANVDVKGNDNVNTPNYGHEGVPQGIIVQSQAPMPLPSGGQNGSTGTGAIGNGTAFTATATPGQFQATTLYFDEVGSINMIGSIQSGSYFGTGDVPNHPAVVVGRFTPDHFDVAGNTPIFGTACSSGGFTYLDQSFSYSTQPVMTVTAKAFTGAPATTTKNYTGTLWKLTSSGFGSTYNKAYYPVNVGDIIPALTLNAPIGSIVFADLANGAGVFTFSGTLKIQRLNGTLAPAFKAEIQLSIPTITDSDSVACTGTGCVSGGFAFGATTTGNGIGFSGTAGGKSFYHGRMILLDAIGSELLALTMPIQTQFYTTANGYVLNTADSCTTYTGGITNLILTPSSGLSTTASFPGGLVCSQGNLNISFSAPNLTGYVDVEAKIGAGDGNLPWLQYNWPYSGAAGTDFTANPRARGNFGVSKGNDRIIYKKEIY